MDTNNALHWLDYVIFLALLLTTILIGVYFAVTGKRQKSVAEYFTGNRKLSFIPTIISYIVSFRASGSIIGLPVETYYFGGQYLLTVCYLLGTLCAAHVIIPVIYPLKLISLNGYLELRWKSKLLKQICSALIVIRSVLYLGIVIYSSSIVISVVANWPLATVAIVTSAVSILFTMIGGIKAVIWTDVLLCMCMFSGVIMILICAVVKAGGLVNTLHLNNVGGRFDFFDFRLDPTLRFSFWAALIGQNVDHFCAHAFTQASVQRYCNVKTLDKAKQTMLLSALGEVFFFVLCLLIGFVLYAYYASIQCDPLASGAIESPNLLVPYFVLENLHYPGILGFFSACVIAASVSTVSSFLNSAAAILWDDFGRHFVPEVSMSRATTISKIIVLVLGILSTIFSLTVEYLGGTLIQLFKSLSILVIPVYGVYVASMFWPWFNKKGLFAGGMSSLVVLLWISIGQYTTDTWKQAMLPTSTEQCIMGENSSIVLTNEINHDYLAPPTSTRNMDMDLAIDVTNRITTIEITNSNAEYHGNGNNDANILVWIYNISFLWYGTLGLLIFFIVGSLVSICTGREKVSNIDGKLLVKWYRGKAMVDSKETDSLQKPDLDDEYIIERKV